MGKSRHQELFQSHSIVVGGMLRCTTGPHQGLQVALDKEVLVLGRAAWCDIPLPNDPLISRYHCELSLSEKGIRLRDLESHNGTFINDVQVYEAPLAQSFRVGESLFVLQSDDGPQSIDIKYYDQSGCLVGQSMKMRKIFSMLARLGQSDASVLLRGETGTGKSSVARALHEQSGRAAYDLVIVNCGALSPSLIEASLFGYEKGAFTGAERRHLGYFEQAHKGTLFLDEIGELPLELQPKLLDVLERKCLRRLGGAEQIEVDFRLITATHVDLKEQLVEKQFREDLYYRLAVAEIEVPPLHERLDDVGLLATYILHQMCPDNPPALTSQAIRKLSEFRWPGNIRQLRNVLERSLVFLDGAALDEGDLLVPKGDDDVECVDVEGTDLPDVSLKELMAIEEKRILLQVVEELGWNISAITKRLKLSRAGLYNRFQKLGIKRP